MEAVARYRLALIQLCLGFLLSRGNPLYDKGSG
jgi:hypothetical protein